MLPLSEKNVYVENGRSFDVEVYKVSHKTGLGIEVAFIVATVQRMHPCFTPWESEM
jgi:hypothetical protein